MLQSAPKTLSLVLKPLDGKLTAELDGHILNSLVTLNVGLLCALIYPYGCETDDEVLQCPQKFL